MQAALALGRHLGIQTIAEGVKEEAQLHRLRRMRCCLVQGLLRRWSLRGHNDSPWTRPSTLAPAAMRRTPREQGASRQRQPRISPTVNASA